MQQGALADRFGKKWFIVAGALFGICGNILAATAKSIETVIGGQALNGIGASLLVCTLLAPILFTLTASYGADTDRQLLVIPASMEIVTAKTRPYAQACTGFFNSAMAIIGLVEGTSLLLPADDTCLMSFGSRVLRKAVRGWMALGFLL